MTALKYSFTSLVLLLLAEVSFGQELPIERAVKEINRQIFDTDGELPGFYTLTNKYHLNSNGHIKSEDIAYSNGERLIRHFNQEGKIVKYQVYRGGKLNEDFTYEYEDNGIRLLKERGTYNLDYFHIDSVSYFGIPVLENGKGHNFDLDTLFIHESKLNYELVRKRKSPKKTLNRYVTSYTSNGSLLSVMIYKNQVQTGHTINKYNSLAQVIERQDFWDYRFFANEDEWSEYLSNRVYMFSYDSAGLIKTLTTEIYNPIDRKWEIQSQDFECSIELKDNLNIGRCKCSGEDYLVLTIDQNGNWIEKEKYRKGKKEISSRNLTYYD